MDIIKKIVSCEHYLMLCVLYPEYVLEKRVDPHEERPTIFIGRLKSEVKRALERRGKPYIIWTEAGGEVALTREDIFYLVTRRKRNYKEVYDKMSFLEFLNNLRVMKLIDRFPVEEEEGSIYPIFEKITTGSKQALSLTFESLHKIPPWRLLASLITFYGRVIKLSEIEDVGKSAHYQMILKRAQKKKTLYMKAVLSLEEISELKPELQILHLIMKVVG